MTDLASIRALRVISRQSTRRYRGSSKPVTTIARELGVDALIQGSVLRTGHRIRLNVQLIDGRTDQHLWADTYEHDLRDIERLQRETVEAIVGKIRVALTPGERARLDRARPVKEAAHEAYLRGRYLMGGIAESAPETARALAEFSRAVELDPTYAPAHVGVAHAHQLRGTFHGGYPPLPERTLAFAAARRALDLDPDLGEAHAIMATVQLSEFDWAGAEQSFARMLEMSPGHAPGLVWYAYQLLLKGRIHEALDVARRAEAINPLDLNTRVRVGFVHRFARKHDEAIRKYREVIALDPNNINAWSFLSGDCNILGKHEEAITAASEVLARQGRQPLALSQLAGAHGRAGHLGEANAFIAELQALARRQYVSPGRLAMAYAGLGDRDRAFEWFERAYEERSNLMLFYPMEPAFAWPDDPRYTRLVSRIRQQHAVRGGS